MWVLQKLRSILFPFAACGRESIIEETAPVQKYEPALTCTSPAESSAETLSWFEDDLMFDFEPEAKEQEEEIDEDVAERINRLLHTDDTYLRELRAVVEPLVGSSLDEIAESLVSQNYFVVKRTVNYPKGQSMYKLRNSFLVVLRRRQLANVWDDDVEEILIDPSFQSHFILGVHEPMYNRITDMLPQSLIAPEDTFDNLVLEGAVEMEKAFEQLGEVVPPWRTYKAIRSKWFSEAMVDEPVVNKSWVPPSASELVIHKIPVSPTCLVNSESTRADIF